MLFKSAIMTQASGSIGGMVASHNRGGMYFRARTIPVDPSTARQLAVRASMAALAVRWNDILTLPQRTAWNLYASRVTLQGPLGDPITVSGINHYIRSNVPRAALAFPVIDDGPTIFNLGEFTPLGFAIGASEATQIISIPFTPTDAWNAAGGNLFFYSGRPANAGVSFFKGPYRHAFTAQGDLPAISPALIPSAYVISEGQQVWISARASTPDGRLSTIQTVGPIGVGA